MRITFLSPPPNLSGGLRVIAIHADRLQARGHDVTVLARRPKTPTVAQRLRAALGGPPVKTPPRRTHLDDMRAELRFLDHRGPVTDRDVPDGDVVIATWWSLAADVAALSPAKGVKAYFMQDYGKENQPIGDLVPTWRLPLRIVTISGWLRDLVHAHVPDARISLVPNAVDAGLFRAPPRGRQARPTVGLVYRAMPTKGADTAFAAIRHARRRIPDLQVVAYGPKPPPASADLPDDLVFHHQPANDALADIYAACDAWLFPSRREGFGLPVLEAMACRCPVVATRAGCAPDVIEDGVNGFVVEVDDAAAMGARLAEVLERPEPAWRAMSDAAHARATGYDWDDAAALFEDALRAAGARGTPATAGG